jgi:hypothetical protein
MPETLKKQPERRGSVKTVLTLIATAAITSLGFAETKRLNLSLIPEVALHDSSDRIEGLTLSLWGENNQKSLALGIVNGTPGTSSGVTLGGFNYADDYTGFQSGIINLVDGDFTGWQDGFVNYTAGSFRGLQTGWINYAGTLTGLQLGVINYAESCEDGLQIGILNVITDNDWCTDLWESFAPGMIFLNWSF